MPSDLSGGESGQIGVIGQIRDVLSVGSAEGMPVDQQVWVGERVARPTEEIGSFLAECEGRGAVCAMTSR